MTRLLLVPTRLELAAMPGAPSVADTLAGSGRWGDLQVALCGFGPVDAGIGAMAALDRFPDTTVCVLAGLAGTLDDRQLGVGAVCEGSVFRLDGVGVGERTIEESALPDGCTGELPLQGTEPASHSLGLEIPRVELLTVCAASASAEAAGLRRERHAPALAEEMEGFAVARAARQRGVALACIRAISNPAGRREPESWDVRGALRALSEAIESTFS